LVRVLSVILACVVVCFHPICVIAEADRVVSRIPRPEHPRPDFRRKAWQNLNGEWQFAIDPLKTGVALGCKSGVELPLQITVPFCPESKLSRLGRTEFLDAVWYRRKFTVNKELRGRRLLLHLGAVDYDATVWVNGKKVAHHKGGYTPFSADITNAVNMDGENEVVVYAVDDLRLTLQPSGKQSHSLHSEGCMYTRTTGIWQTVWLESVPRIRISSLTIRPHAANARVSIEVTVLDPKDGLTLEVRALADGKAVARTRLDPARERNIVALAIPKPVLWQPGKPYLYDLRVRLLDRGKVADEVLSYFGLRDVRIEGDRILINGKPVFLRLVLDQGYWPDGIYTAPSDAELKADIERSMAVGFNGARLHQKVFEPRTLYWADKLGYLVWAEFPDWGCSVRSHRVARENFLREWREVLLRDRNHPSIVAWTPFNETRPDEDRYAPAFIREIYDLTKRLDPSRPVVDTSGYTHVKTDIWDLHDYNHNPETFSERYDRFGRDPKTATLPGRRPDLEPLYAGEPVVISEFGGAWWNPGRKDNRVWRYGDRPADEQAFVARFTAMTKALLDNPHIAGFGYTQLTDVEQEVNGLYTYDRKPKFPPEALKAAVARKAAIEK